jgi:GTP-binding protein EngB required for normal cell division
MKEQKLLAWYNENARPFLKKVAVDSLPGLDADHKRLTRLLALPNEVTVCFLGNSAVGKSTLLNALVANADQIVPSGGYGPLTAQATEVRYGATKSFKVTYQPKKLLWQIAFALESSISKQNQVKANDNKLEKNSAPLRHEDVFVKNLDIDDIDEVLSNLNNPPEAIEPGKKDSTEEHVKQAKLLISGEQFSNHPITYLADAIRSACEYDLKWNTTFDPSDVKRIEKIKSVLKLSDKERTQEYKQYEDNNFNENLKDHAAGFLAPLIQRIEVYWPSALLEQGLTLVDLPGVGIARDSYRDITKHFIRQKARAVIVVVDRGGVTEATIDLLQTSGYWERLVGSSDDPQSDPCSLLVAVTKVDDVATEEWRNIPQSDGGQKPKKKDIYAQTAANFKPRMSSQIEEQLGKIRRSDNEAVQSARNYACKAILETLEIHPVSAPEYRKLLLDDEEDKTFLQTEEQTGIPELRQSLVQLVEEERRIRRQQISDVYTRFANSLSDELNIANSQWRAQERAAGEAERVATALDSVLPAKKKEYDVRRGAYNEFLNATVEVKITALVSEAQRVAEKDVNSYLFDLRSAHWSTLRAAVRRGGYFVGSRRICLPDDIAVRFQEPMSAVWGPKLLKTIRSKTSAFSSDVAAIVGELCIWANSNAHTVVDEQLLENQKARIDGRADQMRQVGNEASDDLRNTVKLKLMDVIRKPIEEKCGAFVKSGDDAGPGVKNRIIQLFAELALQSTEAAAAPASEILKSNFAKVRAEIHTSFEQWGDPIQETANMIVVRHEDRVRRSDAQRRGDILAELDTVFAKSPIPNSLGRTKDTEMKSS